MIRKVKIKKAGSALITTVILFAFIITVSTAFLSMSLGNYNARIVENKRVQNLYGAESGLDTAYNVIENTISVACQYGDFEVRKLKEEFKQINNFDNDGYKALDNSNSDKKRIYALYGNIQSLKSSNSATNQNNQSKIDEYNKYIDEVYNKYFQDRFIEVMDNNLKKYLQDTEGTKGVYVKAEVNNNELNFNEDEKLSYDNANITALFKNSDGKELDEIKTELEGKNVDVKIEDGYDKEGKIKYKNTDIIIEYFKKDIITNVVLLSTFKTDKTNAKIGQNEREIQSTYEIRLPNYDEIGFKTSENIAPPKKLPGFIIGGDMEVNGAKKLNVNGDIFVEGKEKDINKENRTYDKYEGGIKLNNDSGMNTQINFNDNVYTRGTFNIKNNVDVNVKKNLYAKNIYAGNINQIADDSILNVCNDTILDNDLTMKAKNTKITLNNFYGVNDKTTNDDEKPMKSSSIIINSPDEEDSSVEIKNQAYIAGVAHINTDSGYETGESVAVKGNYKAYSSTVDGNEKFKYDNPLQVLDEDIVFNKAKHFGLYWSGKSVNCGGVKFGNIAEVKSIGAIVGNDGQIVVPQINIEDLGANSHFSTKRNDYAEKVFNIIEKDNMIKYGNREEAEKVSDILGQNFQGKVQQIANDTENFKSTKVYNGSQAFNEELNITGNIIVNGSIAFYKPVNITGNIIVNGAVEFHDKANIKGVIIQKGNLKFDNEVNVRGDMMVDGNLVMENSEKINLTYDKFITESMQNQYADIFNKIFNEEYGGQIIENNVHSITKANGGDFIKAKLWKIKK